MSSNKYNRENLVGSGTFGNVWMVTPKTNRNMLVMKEVKLASMTEREREQALTEVDVLSRCQHKNIIKYEEAIYEKEKGMLCIVMEYAEGGDLYTAISKQKGKFFEEHCIMSWFIQICLALEYIHSQNILHRDLKSQNIFLTKSKLIKVGDFGIARVLKENHELATTAIGTPYYLSPEICLRKPYNFKSDIWALGCVLFEMASLFHPFQAKSLHQLISKILKSERRDLPTHCGPMIENLVDILLKSDPEERPSTSKILSMPRLQFYLNMYLNVHGTDLTFSNKMSLHTKEQLLNVRRHSANDILQDINQSSSIRSFSVNPDTSKVQRSVSFKKSNESTKNHSYGQKPEEIICSKSSTPKSGKTRIPTLVRRPTPCLKNKKTLKKEESLKNCSPDGGTFTLSQDLSNMGNASYRKEDEPKSQDQEGDGGYHSADTSKRLLTTKMFSKTVSKAFASRSLSVSDADHLKSSVNFDDCNMATSVWEGLHCLHAFQCNQCMMDSLWKKRIRNDNQVNKIEQSRLRAYLHSFFGKQLFDKIYYVLNLEWENDQSRASEVLSNLIKLLTADQIQHISLVVQLIQLELVNEFR